MKLYRWLMGWLFPPKCLLCGNVLQKGEQDLCVECRESAPNCSFRKNSPQFLDSFTAVWYYEGNVRKSLLRYKFYGARSYGRSYGRLLAERITLNCPEGYDVLTWIPVSRQRKLRRGYDQVELIALSAGRELGIEPVLLLKKVRHNPPQSGISDISRRRANVLGAYRVVNPEAVCGKRILMLDDILTTGATAGECARILKTAGAKEVHCAAVAAVRK